MSTEMEDDENFCQRFLGETSDTREKGLRELTQWLNTHQELNAHTDELTLLRYLRTSKFDVEKAKRRIECMYKLRGTADEWYSNRDPEHPKIQELLKLGLFLPCLKPDSEGRGVILIRVAAHNPRIHSQMDVFKVGLMTLDLFLARDDPLSRAVSMKGVTAVFDLSGVTLAHALQLTVPIIRQAVHSWQDCYPVRVKSLDFINCPSHVHVVLNIFKKFMKTKIKNRTHIYSKNIGNVLENASAALPDEYGGTGGSLHALKEHWAKEVVTSRNWFLEDEKFKYKPK